MSKADGEVSKRDEVGRGKAAADSACRAQRLEGDVQLRTDHPVKGRDRLRGRVAGLRGGGNARGDQRDGEKAREGLPHDRWWPRTH